MFKIRRVFDKRIIIRLAAIAAAVGFIFFMSNLPSAPPVSFLESVYPMNGKHIAEVMSLLGPPHDTLPCQVSLRIPGEPDRSTEGYAAIYQERINDTTQVTLELCAVGVTVVASKLETIKVYTEKAEIKTMQELDRGSLEKVPTLDRIFPNDLTTPGLEI